MKRITFLTAAFLCLSGLTESPAQDTQSNRNMEELKLTQEWDKTFPKSDKVNHSKVTFVNRYGITLAADLYVPKTTAGGELPAIAVSGPFGAVKEQSSGLYAQTLAERGFLTIAFDPSFTGESGGQPRSVASPDINTEDFSAAVDYLATRPDVDAGRIGIIGIILCGSVTVDFWHTGMVARFPTLIGAVMLVIAGILLFIAGIILDVMAKNDRKAFIIDANQFAMMRRKK